MTQNEEKPLTTYLLHKSTTHTTGEQFLLHYHGVLDAAMAAGCYFVSVIMIMTTTMQFVESTLFVTIYGRVIVFIMPIDHEISLNDSSSVGATSHPRRKSMPGIAGEARSQRKRDTERNFD